MTYMKTKNQTFRGTKCGIVQEKCEKCETSQIHNKQNKTQRWQTYMKFVPSFKIDKEVKNTNIQSVTYKKVHTPIQRCLEKLHFVLLNTMY